MKKRVLSLFLAIALCLTLTPTGALAAEGQPPEQMVTATQEAETPTPAPQKEEPPPEQTVSVTQEAETPTPAPQKEEPTTPAENSADENASPASPDEKPTENTPAAPEKNPADEEPGKETGKEAGQNEPTAEGENEPLTLALDDAGQNAAEERSTTAELTVNEAVVEAASVTKPDGKDGGTYESLPAALNAAQDGDTVKLLADHTTDWDAIDKEENPDYSTLAVVKKNLTLDLNGKSVDYLMVGELTYGEPRYDEEENETVDVAIAPGELTIIQGETSTPGSVDVIAFMSGKLTVQGGIINDKIECAQRSDAENITSETKYGGEINITGGTVRSLYVKENTNVTVTGGTGHAGNWLNDSGTLKIQGGKFDSVNFLNNGGTIAVSGGEFGTITNSDASSSIPLMPLLANGYAFYKDNAVQDSTAKTMTDVTVGAHTHTPDENGKCACGASIIASVKTADGTERTYGSFTDALAAAVESNGSTLQLHYDVDLGDANDGLSVDSGKFTLDLNGKTLSGEVYNQLLAVSGTANITIKNGKLINTFYKDQSDINSGLANAVQINGGAMALEDIEVTSGRGEDGAYTDAVEVDDGSLTVTSGTFTGAITVMSESSDVHPTLKIKTATLHNGITYLTKNTSQPDYDVVKAFFADGSLLFDKDGKYIDITKAEYWESGSTEEYSISVFQYGEESSVKPHTHTIVNGKCSVCGERAGDGCIAHAVWSPWADDPIWGTTCITTMDELRKKITSPSTEWSDFDKNATVTFLCDVTVDKTFLIDSYFTNIIIDLNGHTLSGDLDGPVITANFVSGPATIVFKNGKIVNTGNGEAIRLANGRVTLENVDVTGDLSLTPEFVNSRSYIPTFLGGGSFTKICTVNDAGGWQKYLEDMLPKGYYFADITSGKRVSQTVLKADSPLENVTVKPCNHKDADGKSTFTYKPERQTYYYCSICGNICPHEHRTELADGKLHCEDCGLTLTAARRDSKNTITYYIDMSDAFGNAYQPIIWPLCDQTCTQAAMTYDGSKTIDLNGFTVTAKDPSGGLFAPYVSDYTMTLQNSAENQGQYVCEYLKVYNNGTLAIPAENNNLTISAVLIESDGNANLAGGSFGKISVKGEKTLAGLLVPGYYFADTASGEPAAMYDADGTALTELTNVTVKPCSHDTAVCDANGVWKCLCGQNVFVASVTKDDATTYYTDLQNAFSAADGNTVKLMANVRDVTVSTDKPFTFDLNGYNVYSLTVNNKITIKDSATVKGKITECLKVPSGMTVGELLEDGYAFKKSSGTWCSEAEQAGQAVGDVSIWPVPIRSVTAANPSVTVAYGQTSGVTLTATVVPFAEGGTYTCQWYKIGGTVSPLDGATDSTYQLPVDLAAGTYTYRLTATEDGYEKSCDFTVTVTPVSIEGAAVNVQSLTYNGNAQNPTATVSLGETVLTENRDYTVTATPQTDVGSYMLTVTGKGNYTGKIENVEWKIEPMQLYRFCDIEPVTKVYDGTAVAPIAKSALTFRTTGAVVTLPEDVYDITNARFTMRQGDGTYVESPEAGNGKSLSFTVTLKSGNYVFKSGTADVMDCDYTTDKVDMFTIMQDTISLSGIQFTQYVFNDLAKTYEIDLKQFLDTILPEGGEYGDIKYGKPSVFMDSDYYPAGGANIENGKLSLSINKATSIKQGDEIGTVAVEVETTNYQPFTLTIHVSAQDKLVPVLAEGNTVSATDITYGQKLANSKLTVNGTMQDSATGNAVNGTFAWKDGTIKPAANDSYEAEWTFTPDAPEYATVTGKATVKVKPAKLTVSVKASSMYYTGEEQIASIIASGESVDSTPVTFTYSDKVDGNYTSGGPTFTDAGTYTVYYKAEAANHEPATGTFTVTIEPLPISLLSVSSISKTYDGSADVTLTADKLTFLSKTAQIKLPDTVLTFSNAQFTSKQEDGSYLPSPEVGGGKALSFTMTLTSNNYVFEGTSGGTTEVSDVFATDDVNRFTITKAAAPTMQPIELTVINGLAKTYLVNLPALPTLGDNCKYGSIEYEACNFDLIGEGGYANSTATITSNDEFQLTVPAVESQTEGSVGTVGVKITTDNYQDMLLTVEVIAKNKIVPVPDGEITATPITFGQILRVSTITGTMKDDGKTVEGTFEWTEPSTKPDKAGDYQAEWTFTPAEGYEEYATATGTVTIKVNKATPTFTAPTAQENLTYTGQEQALITAGMTDYGTMQYSLTENGTYSQDIPTGTDAGAYTVWYRVIGDANHNDTTPASVAVRIGQKPLTITGVTAASKPYDGTTNADISSVTFDNVTLNRGTDYNVTASFDDASVGDGKNVTATVTLMGQAANNYALEQSSFTATGSITKATAPDFTMETALVIINGYEKTYTVTLPTLPTLETPKEYGALTYEISKIKLDGGYYTGGAKVENGKLTLPIQKNDVETTGSVGTVTVVIKSINYEDITLTVKVSAVNQITPVPEDGTITATPITYGNELSASTITGTMQDPTTREEVNGTFTWVTPAVKLNAASHNAKWTFTPDESYGGKYTTNTGTATVTVTPKAVTVSGITAKDKVYDGNTDAVLDYSKVTLNGVLENDALTVTATGTFEKADTGKQKVTISGFKLGGASAANYVPAAEGSQRETTATITAREVTVAITPNGGTYGSVTAAAATLSGAVDGETVPVTLTYTGNGYNSTSVPTDVGSYTVTASIADSNYILTGGTTANFVITPKTVIVSGITAKDKAYDGTTNATLDFSNAKFDGILENDKLTVTAKGVFEKTEAGKWKVAISDLTLGGNSVANYVLAESGNQTKTTATITAKQITVSITPNGGTYGETITPATVKANGVVGEDAPEITLTYTGTANDGTEYTGTTPPAKAGTYTVTATTTNPNYTLDPDTNTNTAEFAIAKRPATVTPDNQSKVYEEKDPELTYKVRGVLDGETLKGITLTRAEGENAGKYAITATADAGANLNYDVTFAEGKFTINPKSIDGATVKLGKALTANGAEQTQTVEKVLLGDKEIPADSYTVAGNTATAPGSHTLTITAKGNYTGTVEQTYVIIPAKAEDAPGAEIAMKVVVKSEGAVPPATLLTDKAELLAMLVDNGDITADELAQIADGASVDLVLTVKEANVPDEVKTAMAQATKDYTIGQYLDISLFKYMTVNGSQQTGVALRTTRDALTISVVVPDALINTNSAVNRTYCIVRNHEGTITVLDAAFNAASKTLTFKTDRFSDYAIAYKDTAVPSSGSNPGSNNSSNDSEAKKDEVAAPTPAPTPASTSKPSTITAMPQTGDTSTPTLCVVLLVASLLGLAVVFVCKKRNDK